MLLCPNVVVFKLRFEKIREKKYAVHGYFSCWLFARLVF